MAKERKQNKFKKKKKCHNISGRPIYNKLCFHTNLMFYRWGQLRNATHYFDRHKYISKNENIV